MGQSRSCPVCFTSASQAKLFVKNSADMEKMSGFSFASRKEPEFMSHRMVQCPTCDLVYVDEPPDQQALAIAYHAADYDSADEADDAARVYIKAIQPTLARLPQRHRALEIGTGTGAFLQGLKDQGFSELVGIEPSSAAIAAAPTERRAWIRQGIFEEGDFQPRSFDLICCFMTMEHVVDPRALSEAARRLLRDGGAFVTVTHDYRSIVNRLLGRRSPIVDIEHMQLFSARSIHELLHRCGFVDIQTARFANDYALQYWLRLSPLPRGMKSAIRAFLRTANLENLKLSLNVGNTLAVGLTPVTGQR